MARTTASERAAAVLERVRLVPPIPAYSGWRGAPPRPAGRVPPWGAERSGPGGRWGGVERAERAARGAERPGGPGVLGRDSAEGSVPGSAS
ncbi:hypothetical protein ACFY2N_07305 [Streptomyces rubiginosohelvolus]|uniref:hypothetical protein n=1 Tax=Streptomyces rubiginosohelvolus TaxID=67362 RepID=UPI0036B9163B